MASVTVDRGDGVAHAGGQRYRWSLHGEAYSASCLSGDRSLVVAAGDATLWCVFDGAGGQPLDRESSSAAVDAVVAAGRDALHTLGLVPLLRTIDKAVSARTLGRGASTASLLLSNRDGFWAASVGDSEVWGMRGTELVHLSENSVPGKIGNDHLEEVAVSGPFTGMDLVLMGSDGLWNELWPEIACREIKRGGGARTLADRIRTKKGSVSVLADDLTIVLVSTDSGPSGLV